MKKCSCCGNDDDVQMHHLYPKSQGCPDTLMIPLCYTCHRKAHGLKTSLNHSELTRAGLMKAKARGVKMGGLRSKSLESMNRARIAKADIRAESMGYDLMAMKRSGMTFQSIADEMNARKIPTANGKRWHPTTAKNLIDRTVAVKERT